MPGRGSTARRAVIGGVAATVVAALLVAGVLWGLRTGRVEGRALQSERFDAGPADQRAASVAADGPLLLPDPTGGSTDIVLNHLGDDPGTGWVAFVARVPGSPRSCTVRWIGSAGRFEDPCTGIRYPADGTGLPRLEVTVVDGRVLVDLRGRPPDGTG